MDETDTEAAPVPDPQPKTRPSLNTQFVALLVTIVGTGGVLATLMLTTTSRMEDRFNAAMARSDARFEKFFTEAAADRRAEDAKMEAFRRRMDEYRRESDAKMDEYRRDSDAKMDEFRRQMRQLGQRQAHLEGQIEGNPVR